MDSRLNFSMRFLLKMQQSPTHSWLASPSLVTFNRCLRYEVHWRSWSTCLGGGGLTLLGNRWKVRRGEGQTASPVRQRRKTRSLNQWVDRSVRLVPSPAFTIAWCEMTKSAFE